MLTSKLRRLIRGPQGSSGVSAVEFALAAVALTVMIVPTTDLGMGFYAQAQVQNAAQAGAQYALIHGFDSTGITNAVTNATTYASMSATPAPVLSCGCATGTAITTVACTDTCPGNLPPGKYVTVGAQAP
jgi:Flp pilus assembly protein TadG